IEDGGNKSGVPTVNGAIVFDDRFRGKPLVYCGTGAIMSPQYKGKNAWEKPVDAGDRILVAGGRVGKDGIHGATFSSVEIDEHSPSSAVQIGSPITQKLVNDFLIRACEAGLVKCSTDNGAGGLSSSIGEMATISNGAVVELEKVPLKYSGLKPWEIFVSESQERMTLIVEPDQQAAIMQMASDMEVELTDVGYFTNDGYLEVRYDNTPIASLNMHFLHEGVPIKHMPAEWQKPDLHEPKLPENLDYNDCLMQLMGSLNICSRENVIRQYDHEVKGKTIIKPLMGDKGKSPQDAAVMRVDFEGYEGIAISNGIIPRYGDIDAYEMSAGAFDEAVRQIISVGGSLPNMNKADGIFWSINDNFCVPDSQYHPDTNPDGKIKCAKLVQMCEALYDMATYFDIPLTSGKDSMKNDYKGDGVKISIPPTILYSMTAKVNDIRHTVTSNFKAAGDLIYQVGATYDELGASEFYQLFGELGANVPKVRKADAKCLYQKVMAANTQRLIASSHDLSDGGLAVALVESALGSGFGFHVHLGDFKDLSLAATLFSESHSRFVVSVAPEHQTAFETIMGKDVHLLGKVNTTGVAIVICNKETVIDLPIATLQESWENGLNKEN
ncbi:MAG: AIR synthase-related protein, partial [Chitinophagales bacterium]